MATKERIASRQMGFVVGGKEPKIILSEVVPDYIVQVVADRRLWLERGKARNGVLIDLENERVLVFDTNNWQIGQKVDPDELKIRKDKSALILVVGKMTFDKVGIVTDSLNFAHKFLMASSPVFVLENGSKLGHVEQLERRKSLLSDSSYKMVSVLKNPKNGIIFWEGRVGKKRKPRQYIDMLRDGSKNKDWLLRLFYKAITDWEDLGFLLDGKPEEQELYKNLRHTKMPPWAISNLRLRNGFKLLDASCKICRWVIDLDGNPTQIDNCDTHTSRNPKEEIQKLITNQRTYRVGRTKSNEICGECMWDNTPGEVYETVKILGESNKSGCINISLNVVCPHHGTLETHKSLPVPGWLVKRSV